MLNPTDTSPIDVSVGLQDPFSYMLAPIIILAGVLVAGIIALVVFHFLKNRKSVVKKVAEPKPVVFKPKDKGALQREYLAKIAKVQADYESGAMDVRTAHQELSAIVRMFVHELTGINAQNFSLLELRAHDVNQVSDLIEEFYAPEFALRTEKDTMNSINDARTVISTWN